MKLELHNQNISIASFVMDTKGEGWQRRESSSSTSVQTRARLTQEDTEGVKLNDDRPEDSEQLSSS
jgi:hypothetical protein